MRISDCYTHNEIEYYMNIGLISEYMLNEYYDTSYHMYLDMKVSFAESYYSRLVINDVATQTAERMETAFLEAVTPSNVVYIAKRLSVLPLPKNTIQLIRLIEEIKHEND